MARKKCEKCNKPPKKAYVLHHTAPTFCVSDTMAAKGGAGMLNMLIELLKSFDERKLRIVYQFACRLK